MLATLRALIERNDFLSGGLMLGALGSAALLVRAYFFRALKWMWSQTTITVEIRNTDSPFFWLVLWLDHQPYSQRARKLTISTMPSGPTSVGPFNGTPDRPTILFSPSVGSHFLTHRGRLLWLRRSRTEGGTDPGGGKIEREGIEITMFGRSQQLLRDLLDEAYDAFEAAVREQARIFVSDYDDWRPAGFVRHRPLDSVILPDGQRERFLADMQRFLASESWYAEMGIPFRRGYLFSGVAGAGKSSLVSAVAGELGINLYVCNLSGSSDTSLQRLLSRVGSRRAIVLMEDIDCAKAAKERDPDGDDRGVSIAGLLNALDGVASQEGCITIMTTNRRDVLDHALTRPGRVDFQIDFGYATQDQAQQLFEHFYGREAARAHHVRHLGDNVSMAQLQEHFLRHRDNAADGADLGLLATPLRVAS